MSVFEHSDYRAFLKAAYVEKAGKNPSFSLRAFSKQVGLSPAALTRILKGEKNLSVERAGELARKLKLADREAEYFVLLVQLSSLKNPDLKANVLERANALRPARGVYDLSVDFFKLIADWYHLAILEMIGVKDVDFTPKGIASFLGIGVVEAELALDRLKRLELLEITATGKPVRLQNRLLVSSQVPNAALRKYNRQILEKAERSIEEQGPTEKAIGTEVFAFDRRQLEEAKKLTDEYLNRMLKLATSSLERHDVYQVAVQFFRLNLEPKKQPPKSP